MVEVVITYKLKDGVTREQYEKWSREVDQPIASSQPGVLDYKIIWIDGAQSGEPFCDVVEVIRVRSWEDWQAVGGREEMQPVIAEFLELAVGDSVQMIYGPVIEP